MIWGITGCVGAGKSTVSKILSDHGARVLDLDRVAARAVKESALGLSAAEALIAVVTGSPERARIEAALLPVIYARVEAWCAESTHPGVLDAALLFEHGLDRYCDFTVCVCCPIGERQRRVALRSTASAGLFTAIETAQWSEEEKARRCQLRLDGTASREALITAVRKAGFPPFGAGSSG